MLTFQAALDPQHTVFRTLRLLGGITDCLPAEIDKMRVLDFYLAFPFRAVDFKFRRGQGALRKTAIAHDHKRPYAGLPEDRDLLVRMRPLQSLAYETLAAKGVIDPDAFQQRMFMPGEVGLPEPLRDRVAEINLEERDVVQMLKTMCATNPLLGPDGIKERSGLMEYRYDVV